MRSIRESTTVGYSLGPGGGIRPLFVEARSVPALVQAISALRFPKRLESPILCAFLTERWQSDGTSVLIYGLQPPKLGWIRLAH